MHKVEVLLTFTASGIPTNANGRAVVSSSSVAAHKVVSSNPGWDEFSLVGKKNPPRCARRKTWPSRIWARVRGVFPRPGETELLPLNEKRWGLFTPPGRVFFLEFSSIGFQVLVSSANLPCEGHAGIMQALGN